MEENDKYKLTFTGDNLIGRAICRTEDGPTYKLTDETTNLLGRTLYRIEALKDFGDVKEGDKGGYVENHSNLSQYGNCWIYDTAKVYSTGYVWGNTWLELLGGVTTVMDKTVKSTWDTNIDTTNGVSYGNNWFA